MNQYAESTRKETLLLIALGTGMAASFFLLFLINNRGPLDFWWRFTIIISMFLILASLFDRDFIHSLVKDVKDKTARKLLYGMLSAVALYAVFYTGDIIFRSILPFAESGIQDVYQFREGVSLLRVTMLIALVIGPGEELLWRGFIQKHCSRKLGPGAGYSLAVTLYTLVHIGSRNPVLIGSACLTGLYWGFWYQRTNSLMLNMVSHILWDIAVFIVFPFHG
jgi:membrane protease YdiL (CAAX protease family)